MHQGKRGRGRASLHLTRSRFFLDEGLPIMLIRRSPQVPFPLHTHEFSELVLVYSGRGIHFTEEGEREVGAGDAFVIAANRAHGYRRVSDLELVNVLFDPLKLRVPESDMSAIRGWSAPGPPEPRRASGGLGRLRAAELARAASIIDALERECAERRPGYRSLCAASLLELIGYLARCFTAGGAESGSLDAGVARAVSLLEASPARAVRMSELVALSGASESTLLRAFRRAFGLSPIAYHLRRRIELARSLLAETSLAVTEIAGRTGFADSNYFSRQFRKQVGSSPREFRRRTREIGHADLEAHGSETRATPAKERGR